MNVLPSVMSIGLSDRYAKEARSFVEEYLRGAPQECVAQLGGIVVQYRGSEPARRQGVHCEVVQFCCQVQPGVDGKASDCTTESCSIIGSVSYRPVRQEQQARLCLYIRDERSMSGLDIPLLMSRGLAIHSVAVRAGGAQRHNWKKADWQRHLFVTYLSSNRMQFFVRCLFGLSRKMIYGAANTLTGLFRRPALGAKG